MVEATQRTPLWQPDARQIAGAETTAFAGWLERQGLAAGIAGDGAALWRWSVAEPAAFWAALWDWCGVIGARGEATLADASRMPGARWFPGAELNFAENLLRRRDNGTAMVFWAEDKVRRRVSWAELWQQTGALAAALRERGVGPGDRVAGYLPNMPEAIIAMLATASIGAVWSSCSPDFGVQGVLDRFGQIEPKVLFTVDGYWYAGKRIDIRPKVREVAARLPSLRAVVQVSHMRGAEGDEVPGAVDYDGFLAPHRGAEPAFRRLPFDHPLYILYSSGTTGAPKCIVHGAGGTLLQHLKEHRLHSGIRAGDRVFYFTTCGWMMWNWLASALASEATLLLYDGSPFHPGPRILFDYADAEGMTLFGTSAKYIDALEKAGMRPRDTHRLTTLRGMASTGSPLVAERFDYVYDAIKPDLHLASISGGTDIVSCFVLGDPTRPVWRGQIQTRGFGMAVEVYDDAGRPLRGGKGELVCTAPFPCMPVMFWNDPDGAKYRAAYFERFPGVWCHGDWAEITPQDGVVIYGRSDATLNPGGVRIGTAEIYRQVEQIPEVVESIVVGQDWDGDVRVVLFVRLRDGAVLDPALIDRIRALIRSHASPRHVPAKILQVSDIPRTRSGKIVELAVRDVVHGRAIKNREALANPEALEQFRDRAELQS